MSFRRLLTTIALGLGLLACEGPTLPIPPPAALTAPDSDGFVTLTGDAPPAALVAAFNENQEQGVLGVADDDGRYVLRLRADSGDAVSYFYFLADGSRSGIGDLVVPASLP